MMALERTPFGKAMRKHFQFHPNFCPVNHGAFGAAPKYVLEEQLRLQAELEERPDTYIRYGFPNALTKSRQVIAEFVHAALDELVYIQNATTGYNTILRSIRWQPGDWIVHYDLAYGSMIKTIRYLEETTSVQSHCLDIRFPLSDDDLVAAFENAIKDINARPGQRVRMAVFDTVVSMPGIVIPYTRLVHLCRQLDVLSFVDGAHGVGMLPLDLTALDADFFISNLHKWLFVPRACALLHVPLRNQALVRTSVPTSHAFQPLEPNLKTRQFFPSPSSYFVELFEFVGTLNSQHYLSVPAALKWRQEVCGGEEAIRDHCFRLAKEGGDAMAKILGTEVMHSEGADMRNCPFANVRLPIDIVDGEDGSSSVEGTVSKQDVSILYEWITHYSTTNFDSYFQVIPYYGVFWARMSAQVYLDLDDFIWAGHRFKEICDIIKKGRDEYVKNGRCRLCAEAWEKSNL